MSVKRGKIVVIGTGHVGSAILNALMFLNLAQEIVLINIDREQAIGEAMDASHTLAFSYSSVCSIRVGDYPDCRDAQIIINTAGPSILAGENRSRMDLLHTNLKVMQSIMDSVTRYTRDAIFINVTNPVDVLTYFCIRRYDYPHMFSTGTLLDTARFNKLLGDQLGIDARSVTGYVLGEHGATAFIPWNTVNVGGLPLADFQKEFGLTQPIDRAAMLKAVKESGLDIIEMKGYTSSGIALTTCRVVSAILFNSHSVLPLSVIPDGEYGLHDVAMSLPCVLGEKGISRILTLPLDEEARQGLSECYDYLRGMIRELEL